MILETALGLASKGFHVFPLVPNSKLPAIKEYPELASNDPSKIEAWFNNSHYNLGISTSRFGVHDSLVVVDVDNKNEKNGDDTLLKLELDGFDFPPTLEQTTPTGGRHLVYKAPFQLKQGVDKLGSGLDIRAKGGYIVGAGSSLPQGVYTLKDRDIANAPEWLVQKLQRAPEKETHSPLPSKDIDVVDAIIRATHYLKNEAPESLKGQGGDATAYKVAARVKDYGVDSATCLRLMLEYWFNGSGWTPEKLKLKVDHAYEYGSQPIGAANPALEFKAVVPEVEKSYLDALNETYAIVYEDGGHSILTETVSEKGYSSRRFIPEATFKRKFSPLTVQGSGNKGRALTQAEIWLDWEKRREYQGLCFAPEREARNGYYNTWRGFTVEPINPKDATPEQKLGVDMFLEHALENVCGKNAAHFKWLMGYFSHMIQRPYERPLTTLVFKGTKGTGKNVLCNMVGNLLGRSHYLVAANGRYLTSNFNGHMDSALMLVLDEAFWSGDKAAEGVLKYLTTSEDIIIERKGKEAYTVDNLVRLVVIGNEDWLVPASSDERRYAVFQMGEGKKQNRSYFVKMKDLLENKGGSGLLLHYFKSFDLTEVDVNDAPKTEALLEQKLNSLSALEAWWYGSLSVGYLLRYDFPQETWETRVQKETLRAAFKSYCNERNIRPKFADDEIAFGKKFLAMVPSASGNQKTKGDRRSAYGLPELDLARKEWERRIGHEVKW